MAIYVVAPLDEDDDRPDLTPLIRSIDEKAYVTYAPNIYFLSFKGPTSSLHKMLDLNRYGIAVVVASIGDNFGFAQKDFWDWIKERESE